MRDDFTSQVKDVLAKRVGLHCSNPVCKVLTAGPNSDKSKVTNIGVAAHITAASSNGPRYDPTIQPNQRSSVENGIWLCQSCAKLIDSDTLRYSVELLREWKITAEMEANLELTKEKKAKNITQYDKIFRLMPKLINEFKEDIKNYPIEREFILQGKGWIYNSGGKLILVYFYEDHENLDAKIRLLENNNLIRDITYNNVKRYVLTEEFVEILSEIDPFRID